MDTSTYIYCEDCLGKDGLSTLEEKSIDMILCDPPYGTTARNKWDIPLDLTKLFSEVNRVIKDRGVVIFFSQGMLTAQLMMEWKKHWRYNLVWQKNKPRGFFNAKKMPLRYHEDLVVFYKKLPKYNPQMIETGKPIHACKRKETSKNYGKASGGANKRKGKTDRYPGSILSFPVVNYPDHPTQKPVGLCEFLIRSYTQEDEVVLDMCMGSGTTGEACLNTGRRFIGFENDKKFFNIAARKLGHPTLKDKGDCI